MIFVPLAIVPMQKFVNVSAFVLDQTEAVPGGRDGTDVIRHWLYPPPSGAGTAGHVWSTTMSMAPPALEAGHASRIRSIRATLTLVACQLAAGIGFYAVTASLVAHLRHDLGLLAVAAGTVIGVRTAVQYCLYLPAGALADWLGPARTAAIGCLIRAAGFAALAAAARLPALIGSAILIGVGGCAYTPAGYAILADLPEQWARRGFAWYTAAGQFSAVVGPVIGLVLVAGPGGFASIAWLAAVSWAVAAVLMAPLRTAVVDRVAPPATAGHRLLTRLRDDHALLRFALAGSPATLLVTQAAVVVPLAVPGGRMTTLFLSGGAACAAGAQLPRWRTALTQRGLALGLGSFAAAYALLIPATVLTGLLRTTLVALAGCVYGLAQGALLPALFHRTRTMAPAGLTGVYFGAVNFISGLAALVGGALVGLLFDFPHGGPVAALTGLGGCAAIAAEATTRLPTPDRRHGARGQSRTWRSVED